MVVCFFFLVVCVHTLYGRKMNYKHFDCCFSIFANVSMIIVMIMAWEICEMTANGPNELKLRMQIVNVSVVVGNQLLSGGRTWIMCLPRLRKRHQFSFICDWIDGSASGDSFSILRHKWDLCLHSSSEIFHTVIFSATIYTLIGSQTRTHAPLYVWYWWALKLFNIFNQTELI